ncbi:DUF7133 domain-containing protein [Foetidibacter luteolus]|uniref:DUF7133 domain-containing protein n=1 Tax=Foetidibacter luteolus TaxID=2608880 RepID=UPI00129A3D1D|nr:c-type cytochrome [Foetidibacter luteolus]
MNRICYPFYWPFVFCIAANVLLSGCGTAPVKDKTGDSLSMRKLIPEAEVLPADKAIGKMKVEEGLEVKLAASEPLIAAPVALSFDNKGRMWVVEMMDYMPDTVGTGEDLPTGKVVILSDNNHDGIMDDSKVFLDSLVLPRAICFVEGGLLVAEPPKLWYYTMKDDKPTGRTLVDAAYAEGGNVEHQPNGLFRALDNWIYNAKSSKRYRKEGDKWLIERTHFRGQWGISQDNYGRLFYNTNSEDLLGDFFPPGFGAGNSNQRGVAGFVAKIVEDNRVYPTRPTPGVNRGYMKDVLDDSLRLVNFTAACGPLIYEGGLLGPSYQGNAFVAEPSANLIKRNLLEENGNVIKGKQAYERKEFLASEDERFRPVNLYNGPDGALYIVDMYRGIIQHKTYLTPYLKNEIKERALTQPLNCGRIYKVIPRGSRPEMQTLPVEPALLVSMLGNNNGWVRNQAQQTIVDAKDLAVVPALRQALKDAANPLFITHAVWTLEGLHALTLPDVWPLLHSTQRNVKMQGLAVLPAVVNSANYKQVVQVLDSMVAEKDSVIAPYIAFLAKSIRPFSKTAANSLLIRLAGQYPSNRYVADAIISSLYKEEKAFYDNVFAGATDTATVMVRRFKKVFEDISKAANAGNFERLAKQFPRGAKVYQSVCQTCHGADGNGVTALAPPLNTSDWVLGDKNKLLPIVLYGLTGPVKVAGKLYKAPEISGDMPGIGANDEFSDEDIAQVLSFVRNAWNNKASKINAADVTAVRKKYKDRQKTFTMEELEQIK